MPDRPEERGRETIGEGRFVRLARIRYADPAGRVREWEVAERRVGREAVMVVPRLWPDRAWALVRQYRPPARGPVLEFPAGLLEPGEDPAAGALRELAEETGFVGTVRALYPPAFSTPGLSDEAVHIAVVDVDRRRPENARPRPRPDDGEFVETLLVPFDGAEAFLRERAAAGERFDSKVVAYLLGRARAHDGPPTGPR